MLKYSMIVSWSEVDRCFIVSVPELPGRTADGRTPEEAVKNAEIIIQEWIACALEDGEEIPEPKLFSGVMEEVIEFIKKLVIAWDPNFTKVTPEERLQLEEAIKDPERISHNEIEWD